MDLHGPLLIQADAPRMQNGARDDRVAQRRQPAGVELGQGDLPLVEQVARVDELLERDVAVSGLPAKVAFFVGGVAHVESGAGRCC